MMDQRNLILAIVISIAIILGFQFFYEMPRLERQRALEEQRIAEQAAAGAETGSTVPSPDVATSAPPSAPPSAPGGPTQTVVDRGSVLGETPRIAIRTPSVDGSVSLRGARFDDLSLAHYRVTVDPDSPEITLLSPAGTLHPYFAEFGWVPGDKAVAVPKPDTVWQADGSALTPATPVLLTWSNDRGLRFSQRISVDGHYLFDIEQSVENAGDRTVTLYPYGLISRTGTPETLGFWILHEGPIGVLKGTLDEKDYDDLQDEGSIEQDSTGGWLGITDKYWLVSLVPDQAAGLKTRFGHTIANGQDKYQVDYRGQAITIAPGDSATVNTRLFAGAKVVRLLDDYAERLAIDKFDRAVDFGWFYFLTKPLFYVIRYFNEVTGNFGVAILILTVIIKLIFFPLANKSYRAMSRMKLLAPEMQKLKERYGDDRQRMNQEMMGLYKREKVNPMSGCLPILIQIPVFFALYKVLFVTIEMRHAPFFGWIQDLSAPDPTTIFNLFGLIPFTPPEMLMVGLWPLIMGVSMFLQQKLNPPPPDPVQAKIFMMLPIVFTFLLARFPAGLVIYWTWNNILSIAQQWVIMRRVGKAAHQAPAAAVAAGANPGHQQSEEDEAEEKAQGAEDDSSGATDAGASPSAGSRVRAGRKKRAAAGGQRKAAKKRSRRRAGRKS